MNVVIDRVRELEQEARLFTPSGRVVVAVSGGADSITLLHVLMTLRDEFQINLHVATLDHGIRGQHGADDARFVEKLATDWRIPYTATRIDVPAVIRARYELIKAIEPVARRARYDFQRNLEAVARHTRYDFLVKVAREVNASVIATGHNLDDQVETILMHMLRGTGLAGLRGMQPVTPIAALKLPLSVPADGLRLIRPLLTTPRREIDVYVQALGIVPRHDATNDDPSYLRNRLRHDLTPLLEQIVPNFREAIGRMASVVGDDYAALLGTLPTLDANQSIARRDFLALHPAQQRHLIAQQRQRLAPNDDALDAEALHRIQRFVVETADNTSYNEWLHLKQKRVYFYVDLPYPASAPKLPAETELLITQPITLLGTGWKLVIDHQTADMAYVDSPLHIRLDLPADAQIVLRTLRKGDRYQPAGLNGKSQKLSDTLVNLKVPREWRTQIPLLMVNGVIAWFVVPTPSGVRAKIAEGFRLSTLKNHESTVHICFAQVIVQ
jgi:tRNA(Ile)-lysidine synthase